MTKKSWLKLVVGSQAMLLALSVFGAGRGSQLKGPYYNFLAAPSVEAGVCGYCKKNKKTNTWYCVTGNYDTECFNYTTWCDYYVTPDCC